jgi:outer membrane receptor protein involved in Fe transport
MTTLKKLVWIVCTVAVTWALAGAIAAAAQTPPSTPDVADRRPDEVAFRIDAQPIEGALREFASQANLQLVYETAEVSPNIQSSHVIGAFTPEAALSRLLAHTNLDYKFINDRTVSIRSAAGAPRLRGRVEMESVPADAQPRFAKSESAEVADGPSEQPVPADVTTEREFRYGARRKDMEEVVVTAQKREERLIDVPISIVALNADELQKRNVTSIDDLSLAVPGLYIASSGSFARQIMMRGVSNTSGNSSLIGLYLDEASVTSGPSSQLDLRTYDLERVEALRGPQGTLYGEGSVGGTIRFITKNPMLDQFEMKADVAALFTQDGAPGQRIETALNVPLIDNVLGLRFAGTFDHEGGWMDQPAADKRDFNDQNLVDARIKGLWQPTQQFTASAMAVIHRNDAPPNQGEDANGNYTQTLNLTTTPNIKDDYDLYNLTLTYDFAAARLLSATSHVNQDKETRDVGNRYQYTPPDTPKFDLYNPVFTVSSKIFTEELRLTSIGPGHWQWTVGAYYRDLRSGSGGTYIFELPPPPGTPLPDPTPFQSNSLSKSWAAFGDTSYKFTERLTLGAGLRYFRDDQYVPEDASIGQAAQSGKFHALNPRAYMQYKLSAQINTYVSAAKGFRSGGFNALNQPSYGPESVWTYEFGTKMSLLEGRLGADMAVFYSDYSKYQIIGIDLNNIAAGNVTSNAGNARIKGIEWALSCRPADQWNLSLNGDYVSSKFYEINATSTAYVVGDQLDLFPKYSYSASAQREFTWNGRAGFARLDYSQNGNATYRNRSIGPWYFSESNVINMLNFNLRLQWSDTLSLGVFAQNLLNDRGFTGPGSIEEAAGRSRPRTYGIEFGMKVY